MVRHLCNLQGPSPSESCPLLTPCVAVTVTVPLFPELGSVYLVCSCGPASDREQTWQLQERESHPPGRLSTASGSLVSSDSDLDRVNYHRTIRVDTVASLEDENKIDQRGSVPRGKFVLRLWLETESICIFIWAPGRHPASCTLWDFRHFRGTD